MGLIRNNVQKERKFYNCCMLRTLSPYVAAMKIKFLLAMRLQQ